VRAKNQSILDKPHDCIAASANVRTDGHGLPWYLPIFVIGNLVLNLKAGAIYLQKVICKRA
jgi:hypothetical protein